MATKVSKEMTTNRVLNSRQVRLNTAKYMQVEEVDMVSNQEVVLDKFIRNEGMIRTKALHRTKQMQKLLPGSRMP